MGSRVQHARLPLAPAAPTAISLIARLDLRTLTRLEQGDLAAYGSEYRRVNALLDAAGGELVAALLERGCEVVGTSATIYEPLPPSGDWLSAGVFAHKTAATQAGLGWIGKTGLFVSPEAGPKLRLSTVFTDLALSARRYRGSCGSCRACLDACPVHAGHDVAWKAGMARDLLLTRPPARATWTRSARAGHSAACASPPAVRSDARVVGRSAPLDDPEAAMMWRGPPSSRSTPLAPSATSRHCSHPSLFSGRHAGICRGLRASNARRPSARLRLEPTPTPARVVARSRRPHSTPGGPPAHEVARAPRKPGERGA